MTSRSTIDGLRYAAAPGMTPSAISAGLGLDVATMEFAGALSAGAIGDADLAAGRFDGAGLDVFMVDWTAIAAGTLPLCPRDAGRRHPRPDRRERQLRRDGAWSNGGI